MVRHELPFISGSRVAFPKCIPYAIDPRGICQGYLYDIGTGTYTSLPETKSSQVIWGISGDRILYSEENDTGRQIYLFTLENQTPALPVATEIARDTGSASSANNSVTGTPAAEKSPGFDLLPCIFAISLAGLLPLCKRDR
jgi:Tol biopolymer transport system component